MIVELGKYRTANFGFIKQMIEKERPSDEELPEFIAKYSMVTGVPCIVIAHYVSEVVGMNPPIQNQINRLTDFYHYTEVKE